MLQSQGLPETIYNSMTSEISKGYSDSLHNQGHKHVKNMSLHLSSFYHNYLYRCITCWKTSYDSSKTFILCDPLSCCQFAWMSTTPSETRNSFCFDLSSNLPGKSFPDFKGCSYSLGTSQCKQQNMQN